MRHSYYHGLIEKILKFLIPENKSLLYYGNYNQHLVDSLKPFYSVSVSNQMNDDNSFNLKYIDFHFEDYAAVRVFDYIVLDAALGKTDDICLLLKNVWKASTKHTRIIIHQKNFLWQPVFKIAAFFGLLKKERTNNWLSVGDIHTYLKASGFEPTRSFNKNLCPVKMGFVGPFINWFGSIFPFFDFLKLDQFIVARPVKKIDAVQSDYSAPSLTICLTVRDEGKNIASLVSSLPTICADQEVLFIEGHSIDDTVEQIKRAQAVFPQKNIRLIHQQGIGQGDAIRQGFHEAKGEIIILYEGDGTSDPSDIQYFYECIKNENFEFIEGSRFSYPFISESMPLLNKIGNIFFAKWFSLFLKQRTTDVLSGIKAIRKRDYELIYNTWGFLKTHDPFGDFELLFGSARYGLRIGEIPIHYKPRTNGCSKTRAMKHGSYLAKMALKGYLIFRSSKA